MFHEESSSRISIRLRFGITLSLNIILRSLSLVVGSSLCGLARGLINIFDHDSITILGGDSNPCSFRTSSAVPGQCKVVVDVSCGCLPGLTAVGTDLKLGGTETSVEDGGSKPVLRSTSVHLDLKTIGDGAGNKLPLNRDLAEVLVGELREHVRRHVQVVLVAAGLVGNLDIISAHVLLRI